VLGCCEHVDGPQGAIKSRKFLDQLMDYYLHINPHTIEFVRVPLTPWSRVLLEKITSLCS
jgi:hypothetical protein